MRTLVAGEDPRRVELLAVVAWLLRQPLSWISRR
jgi:hypothetical protein